MYFIELRYTNGQSVRLPEPYILYQQAHQAMVEKYVGQPQYTATIISK